jgi:hypothetical protein
MESEDIIKQAENTSQTMRDFRLLSRDFVKYTIASACSFYMTKINSNFLPYSKFTFEIGSYLVEIEDYYGYSISIDKNNYGNYYIFRLYKREKAFFSKKRLLLKNDFIVDKDGKIFLSAENKKDGYFDIENVIYIKEFLGALEKTAGSSKVLMGDMLK